jgi:3-hydroxyacyl-CoA dehydrogenase
MMKLVEIIQTSQTNPEVVKLMTQYTNSINKTSVHCGDTPGFIVNRLLVPYLAEAIAMVDRGDASIPDIDISMQLGAGHPMGPIQLADYVGLDTCLHILEGWVQDYPNDRFFVPKILRQKVAQGDFGRKSGKGFYHWNGDKVANPA